MCGLQPSLSYNGAVPWNSLPLDIRQSPSLNEFKSKIFNLRIMILIVVESFILLLYKASL